MTNVSRTELRAVLALQPKGLTFRRSDFAQHFPGRFLHATTLRALCNTQELKILNLTNKKNPGPHGFLYQIRYVRSEKQVRASKRARLNIPFKKPVPELPSAARISQPTIQINQQQRPMNQPKHIELPAAEEQVTDTIDGVTMIGHKEVFAHFRQQRDQQRAAVELAIPALKVLVDAMRHKTGQSGHLRSILFSMWNGKPTSMIEVVSLDFELRRNLCLVIQAWGYGRDDWEFFYDAMKQAITDGGLWEWFLEESENLRLLKDYVNAAKANAR